MGFRKKYAYLKTCRSVVTSEDGNDHGLNKIGIYAARRTTSMEVPE